VEHSIRVERVFNLGEYKSLRVVAETVGISDEVWNDPVQLADVRSDLQSEIMASYALHMMTQEENLAELQKKDFKVLYAKYS
jgi:hypothetical protein